MDFHKFYLKFCWFLIVLLVNLQNILLKGDGEKVIRLTGLTQAVKKKIGSHGDMQHVVCVVSVLQSLFFVFFCYFFLFLAQSLVSFPLAPQSSKFSLMASYHCCTCCSYSHVYLLAIQQTDQAVNADTDRIKISS